MITKGGKSGQGVSEDSFFWGKGKEKRDEV